MHSQPECGFNFDTYDLSMNNGSRYANFESDYQDAFAQSDQTYGSNYVIPDAVHVLHNGGAENISEDQIIDGISQANGYLGVNENSTETGIRLELYCIKRIQVQQSIFEVEATEGVSSHPVQGADGSIGGMGKPLNDGVAILHNAFGTIGTANSIDGTVLAHEVGHYLGLYHISGIKDYDCNVNCADQSERSNWLSFGDRVGDTTPAIHNGRKSWCNNPKLDPCVGSCEDAIATGNFFPSENVMSTLTDCKFTFSSGQINRMKFTLENYRQELWNPSSELF